jgi:hypothetical protein
VREAACIMTALMESRCLSFQEIPQTTKLFSTFLEDFPRVSAYYAHPPNEAGLAAAAREVRLSPEVRSAVVNVLREQNRRFGADAPTEKNLDRLASGAVAIVTGQQVGFVFGSRIQLLQSSFCDSLRAVSHRAGHRSRSRFLAGHRRS